MMRCRAVQQKLDLHAGQGLAPSVQRQVEAHLRNCPACRDARERLERLRVLLEAVPATPVPEGFAERVLARVGQRESTAGRGGFDRSRRALWRQVRAGVGTAAALAAGLLLGLFLGHETWQATADSPGQIRQTDPLAVSGLDFLIGPGDDTLAQTYLQLTSSRDG